MKWEDRELWGRWWEIWWWETWVESHFSIRADAWSRPNHGRNSGLLAPLPSLRQCNVPCNHKCPRKVACLNPRHLGDSAREISFTLCSGPVSSASLGRWFIDVILLSSLACTLNPVQGESDDFCSAHDQGQIYTHGESLSSFCCP